MESGAETGKCKCRFSQLTEDGKTVVVQFYKDGELWYRTPEGAKFPAPVTHKGDAAYLVQ